MTSFEGMTAIVTGSAKNIGKAIAIGFAKQGANIVICDKLADKAEETAKEINREYGVETMVIACDVREREKVNKGVEAAIERFGKIDILVNNAGGSAWLLDKITTFADAEPETLDFVIDVNIKGTMNFTQAVLKSMIPNKFGRIINISSIAGVCGIIGRVDYSAAKGAQISMTKALAMEVGKYNICVNCVSPGAIARDGLEPGKNSGFLGEEGRGGVPEDVADAVVSLAAQKYVTGVNLVVDGGRTLGPFAQFWV